MIDKFLVVTHMNHNIKGEKRYAYAPYVKEMMIWSKYVKNIEIIAPVLGEDLNVTRQNYDNKKT